MSGIESSSNFKVSSLNDIGLKPVSRQNNKIVNQLAEFSVSDNINLGSSIKGRIPSSLSTENVLPPVIIKEDGKFTFQHNMNGININTFNSGDWTNNSFLSKDGLSIIYKKNNDKRDVLVFSNMSDNIKSNGRIPNVYFHIPGDGSGRVSFDKNHNIVIELKNNERLVIDGRDGQTVLEGPFSIKFNPENEKDIDVEYTGTGKLRQYQSYGDSIKW